MIKNNNIPKGYKDSPLGIIPVEWEVFEFADIAIQSTKKHNPEKDMEDYRCLELEHFEQGTGNILGYVHFSEQKSIKNKFNVGDVLFGKLRSYLQKYWLAKFEGVCSSEVWVLKNTPICTNDYLFRLVQTHRFIQAANVSSGSKMPRADWDYVASFPFLIPPLPEQQKIAKILSTWDNALEKQTQLIAQLETRKRGLMQQLLTGKKRLKGFEGEWREVQLRDVGKISMCKRIFANETSLQEKIPFYKIGTFGNKPDSFISIELYQKYRQEYSFPNKGDILVSTSGTIGRTVIYNGEPAYFQDSNIVWIANEEQLVMNNYLYYLYQIIKWNTEGATIQRLYNDNFKQIFILIPPIIEQTAIAEILSTADKEIDLAQKRLAGLKEQKKGLMQVLLTGKKRVKI